MIPIGIALICLVISLVIAAYAFFAGLVLGAAGILIAGIAVTAIGVMLFTVAVPAALLTTGTVSYTHLRAAVAVSFSEMYEQLSSLKWKRLSTKKDESCLLYTSRCV